MNGKINKFLYQESITVGLELARCHISDSETIGTPTRRLLKNSKTTQLSLREAKRRGNPDRGMLIDCRAIMLMARNDKSVQYLLLFFNSLQVEALQIFL